MPIPVRDFMRAMNRATILDAIRNAGLISRIDLARTTGFSQSSVTGLTAELIREQLIIEKKVGEYEGGRPPMLLSLNPDGAYVVGVNITFDTIVAVIINMEAKVLAIQRTPIEKNRHSVADIADSIVRAVQACIWEANFSKEQISGVGIGIPGLVDSDSGIIRFMPNYNWENVNLRDLVQVQLKHPIYIENSSNTLAIAEQWLGEGKGVGNFLVITLENGVGLGIVIQGHLYRGQSGTAGEFGHITIDPGGPPCRCGKNGCVEAYAGNISILRAARIAAQNGHWKPQNADITYDDVLNSARAGNACLIDIFKTAGQKLGLGISHLITLFNPAKIIFTGKGVQAGALMFDSMDAEMKQHLSPKFGPSETQIVIKNWNEKDWARGAGTLVLGELYKSPVNQMTGLGKTMQPPE